MLLLTQKRLFGLPACDVPPSSDISTASLHSAIVNKIRRITKTQLEVLRDHATAILALTSITDVY